ncbi:hypothetical protein TNCV_2546021 [Trichonephila clavipes]|nr:hypothetical protein TNCV_2546021 [Trichonephila clavipes]
MTENDAPESTRARIGFYLLLRLVGYQSSWRSTRISSTRGLTSLKVASLVFLAPTAWRLTDRRYGDGWEFLNRSSVFPGYSGVCWSWSSFVGFVDTGAKTLSTSSERSLLRIGDRVQKDSCVWLTSRWTSSRTIVRIRETKSSHPSGMQPVRRLEAFKFPVDHSFRFISSI